MLEFTGQPLPMMSYLEAYLAEGYWCHAADLLEMIGRTPAETWPLWTEERVADREMQFSLLGVLGRWKAFRKGPPGQRGALRRELARFMADIQMLAGSGLYLVNVPDAAIGDLAEAVTDRLVRFSVEVKETESPVLSSKTAHLLLLPLVPAYDNEMIHDQVLRRLTRYGRDMHSYLCLCWWVLRRFQAEDTLEEARARVGAYLLDRCRRVALVHAARDHWLLQTLDTVVAEYTLIGMAESTGDDYPLRWTA